MMNTIIVDSDALIALFNPEDAHAERAEKIAQALHEQKARLIYPATTLVETIDTLKRKLKKHELAADVTRLIIDSQFARDSIEAIDSACLKEAGKLFESGKSSGNTLADAVVGVVAKKYKADAIFSFDAWYGKQGFALASDLL